MRKFLFTFGFFVTTCLLPWLGSGGCGTVGETPSELSGESGEEGLIEPTSLSIGDNGGYTEGNETPGFGLETMGQFTADQGVEDPSVGPEDEAMAEADPEAEVYMIRIVWGNLALNARGEGAPEGEVLGWDGNLSFDGAATLLAKATILFEAGDEIVGEKDERLIGWSSVTGPHVDGLLAKLIVIPGKATDVLSFNTKPLSHEIALADLDHYNEIVTVDEEGHGVAFTAIRIDDNGDCAEGFLEGKYHDRLDGHDGGAFRGRALSAEGDLEGHVRGHYGVNDEDASVFFGKYIDADGLFRGFLRGTYGDGAMAGDWILSDETVGTLAAKYVEGETVDSGFFQGYWQEACE